MQNLSKKREESVFPKIQTCTCWHDTSRTKSWLNKLNEKGNLELHPCWISKKQTSLHCLLFSIKSLLWNSAKKKDLPFVPFLTFAAKNLITVDFDSERLTKSFHKNESKNNKHQISLCILLLLLCSSVFPYLRSTLWLNPSISDQRLCIIRLLEVFWPGKGTVRRFVSLCLAGWRPL